MTLCVIDGKPCRCQPDEGIACDAGSAAEVQASLNAEVMTLQAEIDELRAALSAEPAKPKHVLYEDGDANIPRSVCDRNGDVVLGMCKICGRVEIELSEPCENALELQPTQALTLAMQAEIDELRAAISAEPAGELPPSDFETWWEDTGSLCRSGGGDYEKTFAFRAWEEATRQAIAPLQAEIERLTGCLKRANSLAEEFERKWYLVSDELAQTEQPAQCNYPDCKCPTETPCLKGLVQPAQGEPLFPFRHGCKWCGKSTCAAGCPARKAIAQSKRVPDGYALVPIEPTDEMVRAAFHLDLSYMPGHEGPDRAAIYRKMISAAPQAAQPTPAQPVNQVLLKALKMMVHLVQTYAPKLDGKVLEYAHAAIAQAQTAQPEIDCLKCKNSVICGTGRKVLLAEVNCTNGDKFVKLEPVQLWRNA